MSAATSGVLRERTLGILMLAGGAIAFVTALLPPGAINSEGLVLACGGVAIIGGTLMTIAALQGVEAPTWLLGAGAASSTVLITVATWGGGFADVASADNEILYLWVSLFSFYFFSRRHAFAQLALIAVAYGSLLVVADTGAGAPTRLLVMMTALLVSGLLLSYLHGTEEQRTAEAHERARRDELTGLLNRRGLNEIAVTEFARSRREDAPVGFLIVNVDQFRTYNDLQGHHAGDELLAYIADSLYGSTRAVDAVAYLGADQFGVVLPGAADDELEEVGGRLLSDLRQSWKGPVLATISIGAASGPAEGHSLDDLWGAAERALRAAKAAGGDQIRLARDKLGRVSS